MEDDHDVAAAGVRAVRVDDERRVVAVLCHGLGFLALLCGRCLIPKQAAEEGEERKQKKNRD